MGDSSDDDSMISEEPPLAQVVGSMVPGDDAELEEYGLTLGVDLSQAADADLKPVVQEAFAAPLPSCWTEHLDDEGRVFFFNHLTQESSWVHPMDSVFKEVLELVKAVRRDATKHGDADSKNGDAGSKALEAVQAHLAAVHDRALSQLDGWSGPYASETGQYYYNSERNVSSWDNPVDQWQCELALRQRILYRCLLHVDADAYSGGAGQMSYFAENPATAVATHAADSTPLPRLPLNLAAPRSGDGPKTPSSSRSFATARSGRSARSVRSGRSPTPSARLQSLAHGTSPRGSPTRPGSGAAAAAAAFAAAAPAASASASAPASGAAGVPGATPSDAAANPADAAATLVATGVSATNEGEATLEGGSPEDGSGAVSIDSPLTGSPTNPQAPQPPSQPQTSPAASDDEAAEHAAEAGESPSEMTGMASRSRSKGGRSDGHGVVDGHEADEDTLEFTFGHTEGLTLPKFGKV